MKQLVTSRDGKSFAVRIHRHAKKMGKISLKDLRHPE